MKLSRNAKVGSLTLLQQISRNRRGMSHVYAGTLRERPDSIVAVKFNSNEKPFFSELLRHEAHTLQKLRHPNIVRIYPFLLDEDLFVYEARAVEYEDCPWYFVMEYLDGRSLDTHLPALSQYPLLWLVEFFYQLLIAIQYTHNLGLAHNDLKSENVVLRYRPHPERLPQPVIIDFATASPLDRLLHPAATIPYAPPEVVRMLSAGADRAAQMATLRPEKVDIWGLGTIFFELFTGRRLVEERERPQQVRAILAGKWPSLSDFRPDIPLQLDQLLRRMLAPEAAVRPTVNELIMELEQNNEFVCPPRIAHPAAAKRRRFWQR